MRKKRFPATGTLICFFALCLLLSGCIATMQPVTGAADIDSTAAACSSIARDLNRAFPVSKVTIQVTEDFILERHSGAQLPYSAILSDGLTRELSKLGAQISVERSGATPIVLYASYVRANGSVIIDAKLRRIETNMETSDIAVAEAALPAAGLASDWLKPTLQTLADSLIRQLGDAPAGDRFSLSIAQSIPGAAGQPSLLLAKKFYNAIADAITRTQVFTVVTGSRQEVVLRSSYVVIKDSVHFNAWLERANGKRLASATGTIARSSLADDLFTPMANASITACIRYMQQNGTDLPASSAEAEKLQTTIKGYLQELGIKSIPCTAEKSLYPQVSATVALLPAGTTRDGYSFTTAKIMVQITDSGGSLLGSFHNQAKQGFSSDITRANLKAIDAAAGKGLKDTLSKSLLSVSP